MAKSFSASRRKIFGSIILPGTVPFIFTGLKYGAGRALLGVVVGELYAATAGVGHMMTLASDTFQMDKMFVGLILLAGFGYILTVILTRLEKHFEFWRP
jgi:NitT/TauT family transport system permease protein